MKTARQLVNEARQRIENLTNEDHRAELDPTRRTILYCAGGARSALAVETLRQLGYVDVAHLEGGFTAWTRAGREVSPA
jgi:rhodanese-related sulfurtransferase